MIRWQIDMDIDIDVTVGLASTELQLCRPQHRRGGRGP
jgi:hypothetical protein